MELFGERNPLCVSCLIFFLPSNLPFIFPDSHSRISIPRPRVPSVGCKIRLLNNRLSFDCRKVAIFQLFERLSDVAAIFRLFSGRSFIKLLFVFQYLPVFTSISALIVFFVVYWNIFNFTILFIRSKPIKRNGLYLSPIYFEWDAKAIAKTLE